jgi:hypothetical protein
MNFGSTGRHEIFSGGLCCYTGSLPTIADYAGFVYAGWSTHSHSVMGTPCSVMTFSFCGVN